MYIETRRAPPFLHAHPRDNGNTTRHGSNRVGFLFPDPTRISIRAYIDISTKPNPPLLFSSLPLRAPNAPRETRMDALLAANLAILPSFSGRNPPSRPPSHPPSAPSALGGRPHWKQRRRRSCVHGGERGGDTASWSISTPPRNGWCAVTTEDEMES